MTVDCLPEWSAKFNAAEDLLRAKDDACDVLRYLTWLLRCVHGGPDQWGGAEQAHDMLCHLGAGVWPGTRHALARGAILGLVLRLARVRTVSSDRRTC